MKTAKRTFQLRRKGETKDSIYVEIYTKDRNDILCAWLPKDQIKISNREYGFGGGRWADIEFPLSLMPLFKSIYSKKSKIEAKLQLKGLYAENVKVEDNNNGTFTLKGYDRKMNLTGTFDCIYSLIQID